VSELHHTIIKTVADGLMSKWEEKNPYPELVYSDEVISSILDALQESDEFKITETLFKSEVRKLIPVNILNDSVDITDHEGVLAVADFKLNANLFPELVGSLPSKEGRYGLITSVGVRLTVKNAEKAESEKDSFARARKGWADRRTRAREKVVQSLKMVRSIQDLYVAWPEAADYLPESAKTTGVVLPTDSLNKMLGL